MYQLLLCIELLGTAIPVAIGFIHSLRLRFPILLLQIFPNIKHPQQGVLGEHSQMSTPRYNPSCFLLLGAVPGRSIEPWGSGASQGRGSTWVPVEAGLEMSPSDLSSGYLRVRGLLRLHSNFSCYRGRGESGKQSALRCPLDQHLYVMHCSYVCKAPLPGSV